jgi:hypothetical protein
MMERRLTKKLGSERSVKLATIKPMNSEEDIKPAEKTGGETEGKETDLEDLENMFFQRINEKLLEYGQEIDEEKPQTKLSRWFTLNVK